MKRKHKISILASLFVSVFALNLVPNLSMNPILTKAEDEWESISTRGLAYEGVYTYDGTQSTFAIALTPNDYSAMADSYKHSRTLPYYVSSDYNFLTYVEFSTDNQTYFPLSSIYDTRDLDYFAKSGRFRFNLANGSPEAAEEHATYLYVRVLQGCTFPSYDYCANGGAKKRYVQSETTISKRSGTADGGSYALATYSELVQKPLKTFSNIAPGWNNANYSNNGYRQLILAFGEHGVDYFTNDHQPNATNQATAGYEIGHNLTINGLPIYRINSKFTSTKVGYDHGYGYLYINYPAEVLLMNKNNLVPTFHLQGGTEFLDVLLSEVTLKFVGGCWIVSDADDFRIDDQYDFSSNLMVSLPHEFGTDPHPIFHNLPASGVKLAFTINTGDLDVTNGNAVLNIDGLYNCTVSIHFAAGAVFLIDKDAQNAVVQQFYGFVFSANTKYTFEIEAICGTPSTFKFAINHFVILNQSFANNKTMTCDMWVVDTSGALSMDYYEELEQYKPVILSGASSSYDFIEGDPVYNFAGVIDAFDLYDDNVTFANLVFTYEDGAVTNGKYNAGIWSLLIELSVDGYETASKTITINVHGKTSTAKIYYGDADPIEVPIGSKLVPPPNPNTYREGDYDYVFDGWYFEGAKWDFENDVVQGDMHLVARFKQTAPHYIVTVTFEGIERGQATYSLTLGSSLPFDLFELDGATYEVYRDGSKITSLVVQGDTNITVKYTVVYTYVEAKEATCTGDGNIGYWYSPVYGNYYFADPQGRELIKDVIIPKLNHDIVHLDYKDSTCSELGNIECYYCKNCHKHFSDENAQNELNDWSIAKKPHVLTHHNAVEATCETDGSLEHWTCANEPGVYYGDEACTFTLESIVVYAFGHDYRAPTYTWKEVNGGYECTATITCTHCHDEISETQVATKVIVRDSTCSREGQISYSVRFNDERFNAQNKLVNLEKAPHNFVHVDEIVATESMDGIKEHYECSECHKCFVKEGEEMKEVQYTDLFYKYKAPSSSGCGGSIATPSLVILASAGALTLLIVLRRKEER